MIINYFGVAGVGVHVWLVVREGSDGEFGGAFLRMPEKQRERCGSCAQCDCV